MYNLLGKLGNSSLHPPKKLSELIEPVRDMLEIFIGENDLRSALNRPGWGHGHVDNPRLSHFYKILADFGIDIFNMLDAFYLPGFMVSFSNPAKIPDYKSINASQNLCKFESLKNLLCIGEQAPQVGRRLCQILWGDAQDNLITFKQLTSLLKGEINLIMHNLNLLENERRLVVALNRSYSLLLVNERSSQSYQEKGKKLAGRSSVLNTEDKLLPVEYFRKGRLERAIKDMISLEQIITAQRANLEFLQEQIAIVAYIKNGFLDVLYQGVFERNQLLKSIYPCLGE